jgi:hypothetical protein
MSDQATRFGWWVLVGLLILVAWSVLRALGALS